MKIEYPKVETWYIGRENGIIKIYDSVLPGQVLSTKITDIVAYTDKNEWIKVLKENNIEINEQE